MKRFMDKASYWSIFLAMKLTAVLILVGTIHLSARGLAQSISFTGRDVPMGKVFHAIEEQTGYGVITEKSILEASKPVTLDLHNATVDEVLKACFAFQPRKLKYKISGRTIIVSVEETKTLTDEEVQPALVGVVRGKNGEPLEGATVSVRNTNKKVLTNARGEFVVKGIPSGQYKIDITYVGYERYTAEVTVPEDRQAFVAEMKPASNKLDQVQVIAYGVTTQRLNTGDVTTVTAKDIAKQPVNNPLLALEGRVPGMLITQTNGIPGGGITIRVQGQNSLSMGNDPLYVIDGVPYSAELLPNLGAGILGLSNTASQNAPTGGGSPLAYINPADIESIDVLKDADATAIYGSRAANGAILITTKKGSPGKSKVDLNVQQGVGKVARTLPLLKTRQYLEMRHEAFKNDSLSPDPNVDYDLTFWDTTRYTDWQKALIGKAVQYTDAQASVSGGSIGTNFLLSGGYHRETSVFPGNLSDQKGSLHFNISHASPNQRFKLQFSGFYLYDDNRLISVDLTQTAVTLSPNAPPLHNSDGTLNWATLPSGNSSWYNPLALLAATYENKTSTLNGNAVLSYRILKGLDIKASLGYNNLHSDEVAPYPLSFYAPETQALNNRYTLFENSNISTWSVEPQLSYRQRLGPGTLDFLVGTAFQQTSSNFKQLRATGYNNDLVMNDIYSAATISVYATIPEPESRYSYNAIYGRLNYNINDKYIIDVNARRDGSSRFGPANLFHNFGSVGAAWVFSNENLFKKDLSALSFGKLRASYGTTGNDQIGNYQFLSLFTPVYAVAPYQGAAGYQPNGLANPNLEWELTKKLQVGLDLGFIKDRILLNANYYFNRSSNQLQGYNLPITTGFPSIQVNFPAVVQNSGWELTLNTKNIETKNFSWSSSINFTIPRNKLVSFPNLANSSYASFYVVGQPLTIVKVYHSLGVNDSTGIFQFASKGGPTTNPVYGVDNTAIINTAPKFFGGFQNNLRYKGIELSFLFSFRKQRGVDYSEGSQPGVFASYNIPGANPSNNQPVWVLQRWQKPGDMTRVQKFSAIYSGTWNNILYSDGIYGDASFIRLKNVSLSWDLPQQWMSRGHIQGLRIFVQGQNLATITKYKGMDPENQSIYSLPPLRVLTIGINVSL